MSTPDKPENDEDNPETPETEDTAEEAVADETSGESEETVDAEIVEPEEAASEDEPAHLEAETVSEDQEVPQEEKSQDFATTGVILLGIMAFGLVFFFLSQGNDSGHEAEVAQSGSVELLAPAEEAATEETVAGDTGERAAQSLAQAAQRIADEADTADERVMPVQIVGDPDITDEEAETSESSSAEETAEERRLAAIERNRARREARMGDSSPEQETASAETVALADDAPETDQAPESDRLEGSETVAEVTGTEEEATETDPQEDALTESDALAEADVPGNTIVVSDPKIANEIVRLKEDLIATTEAAMAEDRQRLADQEDQIDRLRQDLDDALAEQERRAQQLEARLDTLQTRDVATASKQAALSIAVTNLQRQISTGRPFADQLSVLENLSPETVGIRALEPYAEAGLPTMSNLRLEFGDSARKALAAANRNEADGFWGQVGARFTGLFSVRKTGFVEGDTPSAVISRAEVHLEEGDLTACLRELDTLDGDAAAAMGSWIDDARSVLLADQLLDSVSSRVLTL